MRIWRWLSRFLLTVLGIVIVTVATASRGPMQLDLWPMPLTFEADGGLLIVGAFLIGLLLGGLFLWPGGWSSRRRAKRLEVRVAELERSLVREKLAASVTPPQDRSDQKAGVREVQASSAETTGIAVPAPVTGAVVGRPTAPLGGGGFGLRWT